MNDAPQQFEEMVDAHYQNLFRFALSLTRNESDASDLTQAAYERLLRCSAQLRDVSKVKTWLFTTLYRLFLEQRKRQDKFPSVALDEVEIPLVAQSSGSFDREAVLAALDQVDETFRTPLMLFYGEQHSYREIAEILDVPIGTVMSRLSRGKALLRALLSDQASKIVPFPLKAAS